MCKQPVRQVSTSVLTDHGIENVSVGLTNDRRVKSTIFTWIVAYLAALTMKSLLPVGEGLFYAEYAVTGTIRPSLFEVRTRCNVNSKTALVCGLFGSSLVVMA